MSLGGSKAHVAISLTGTLFQSLLSSRNSATTFRSFDYLAKGLTVRSVTQDGAASIH